MHSPITLENFWKVPIGELATLSCKDLQELFRQADENLRHAKLMKWWLKYTIKVKSDQDKANVEPLS